MKPFDFIGFYPSWISIPFLLHSRVSCSLQFRSECRPIIHVITHPVIECDPLIGNPSTLETLREPFKPTLCPFPLSPLSLNPLWGEMTGIIRPKALPVRFVIGNDASHTHCSGVVSFASLPSHPLGTFNYLCKARRNDGSGC